MLLIQKLLTTGSIPELAKRSCAIGKEKHFTLTCHWGPNGPTVVVAHPNKKLANRGQKMSSAMLCVNVTGSEYLVYTHQQTMYIFLLAWN